tara:strand:+ start:1415 stop:2050 length:636 start_codon:yes stop_codon:yes gene_type:complete
MKKTKANENFPRKWESGWLRRPDDKYSQQGLVIKIGGSLLTTSGWQHAVQAILADESASEQSIVLISGGGAVVNGLRQIDTTTPSSGPLMHRLALEAMGITAQFVATTLGLPLCEQHSDDSPVVLDISKQWALEAISTLPHSWETTSDSIAATVATTKNSSLLLIKSSPPRNDNIEWLASHGWVDQHFPTACVGLESIRWASQQQPTQENR